MKARFISVKVHKDAMSEIVVDVPEFELSLLQAVNGADVSDDEDGAVAKVGDTAYVFEYEDPTAVYESMKEKYRVDEKGDLWVDKVFGNKAKFVDGLKKIDAAFTKTDKVK